MKVFVVFEPGEAVWAAFTKRKKAERFREREFCDHPGVLVRKIKILDSLRKAPKTRKGQLRCELDLVISRRGKR